ncbi:hypothetical protein F2Q68_00010383 [Brassica cretica]|uniref:Uncharacterized protein n=1 Tax=Brassica cretica TaxID=69181 RepID=A0A8S9KSP8_BRACR|nr:hypothetical protein F2Q68_00010383 [Brassica cretica]
MLGGGVDSLRFSSVRTAIVMSMHTFPSVFGCRNRELVLLVHRIPFARRFWELMEFDSRRLGFPASAFDI